ncbi:MAG: aminopeptidase P N-terminal domain-containing protein [Hominenteromicrobium sp.]
MKAEFHIANRQRLYAEMADGSAAVFFSGHAPRQSADAYYTFFTNRNFLYLTGIRFAGLALMAVKTGGAVQETIYILPPDLLKERWTGRRPKADEVLAQSGISDIRFVERFGDDLHKVLNSGSVTRLYLDLYRHTPDEAPDEAHRLAHRVQAGYPFVQVENILPALKRLRTLKAPCEIDAMRRAMTITREGILRMMRASHPGMYEYEYKAEFDYALTRAGVLEPAFHSIISAGENNFCIHYDSYMGQAKDGDMILNDVGAQWDGECNDVSRGWPCSGRFSKEQRALYECALKTSDYMFSVIKPGMLMDDVDRISHEFCFGELKKLGLLSSYDEIGKYMWHGGAHNVGYDVHDVVDVLGKPIRPNMVFCVDIGIYVEDWGIGFRVEDNCLVTPTGCENLSASVPRTIEDIEAVMLK